MCPLCISSALAVAAGTISTGGVVALATFARRLAHGTEQSTPPSTQDSDR